MFCTKCGTDNGESNDIRFCIKCGNPFTNVLNAPVAASNPISTQNTQNTQTSEELLGAENVKFLSDYGIPVDESPFVTSCRIAFFKNRVEEQLDHDKAILNGNYMSNAEYSRKFFQNNKMTFLQKQQYLGYGWLIKRAIVLLIIIASSVVICIINALCEAAGIEVTLDTAIYFLLVPVVLYIGFYNWIVKYKLKQVLNSELAEYSSWRESCKKEMPDAKVRCSRNEVLVPKIDACLNSICVDRSTIPEAYWGYGGEFLYLYTTRRADNVKEAINIWEQVLHQMRVEEEQRRQGIVMENRLDNITNIAMEAREYARNAEIAACAATAAADSAAFMAAYR